MFLKTSCKNINKETKINNTKLFLWDYPIHLLSSLDQVTAFIRGLPSIFRPISAVDIDGFLFFF